MEGLLIGCVGEHLHNYSKRAGETGQSAMVDDVPTSDLLISNSHESKTLRAH